MIILCSGLQRWDVKRRTLKIVMSFFQFLFQTPHEASLDASRPRRPMPHLHHLLLNAQMSPPLSIKKHVLSGHVVQSLTPSGWSSEACALHYFWLIPGSFGGAMTPLLSKKCVFIYANDKQKRRGAASECKHLNANHSIIFTFILYI